LTRGSARTPRWRPWGPARAATGANELTIATIKSARDAFMIAPSAGPAPRLRTKRENQNVVLNSPRSGTAADDAGAFVVLGRRLRAGAGGAGAGAGGAGARVFAGAVEVSTTA